MAIPLMSFLSITVNLAGTVVAVLWLLTMPHTKPGWIRAKVGDLGWLSIAAGIVLGDSMNLFGVWSVVSPQEIIFSSAFAAVLLDEVIANWDNRPRWRKKVGEKGKALIKKLLGKLKPTPPRHPLPTPA